MSGARALAPVSAAAAPRLQRQCACGGPLRLAGPAAPCEECRKRKRAKLQRQAVVGPADDAWEREAERIADEVMAGGRRSAVTPVAAVVPHAQREPEDKCPTQPGDSGRIAAGPLARWDWVRYAGLVKLGNRVFAKGSPPVGAWPWLTNNPGDITVDKSQAGKPRNAQNRAYDFGAMPGKSVSTGKVPLAVFATMDEGLRALQLLLAEPDYRDKTIRQAVDHHLGGKDNENRMPGVDDTHTAVDRIVRKLADLGVKATAQTRLSALAADEHLDEAAQAFGFAEGVENVGLTYRCGGRDKTDDPRIPATVWKFWLKNIPDATPPEVSALLCCESGQGGQGGKGQAQRASDEHVAAPAGTEAAAPEGGGAPLPAGLRADLEVRFGHSFAAVRVHADAGAARAAAAVGARAYTLGTHIVFGAGHYAPHVAAGRRLIAHELTHVVQQQGAGAPAVAQRDLAVEPKGVDQTERALSEQDIRAAIAFNKAKLKTAANIALVRDVLGVDKAPAESDRALALAVARFQAAHGVAQDGQLGPVTMLLVVEEVQAEALGAEAERLKKLFPAGVFIDLDTAFCGCKPLLTREIASADHFIAEYTACGADPAVADGPAVETCIQTRAAAAGSSVTVLGTTAAGGQISLSGARRGACGPLMERIDLAHEQIHSVHEGELKQAHGAGTRAFTRARNDKADWVNNEIQSRNTDKSLAHWALAVLDRICP